MYRSSVGIFYHLSAIVFAIIAIPFAFNYLHRMFLFENLSHLFHSALFFYFVYLFFKTAYISTYTLTFDSRSLKYKRFWKETFIPYNHMKSIIFVDSGVKNWMYGLGSVVVNRKHSSVSIPFCLDRMNEETKEKFLTEWREKTGLQFYHQKKFF